MCKPAMRHLYQSFAMQSSDPDHMMDYFESVFTLFSTALEGTALFSANRQAGIMESIYGYQRISDGTGGILYSSTNDNHSNNNVGYSEMTLTQKTASMLYILLIPRILSILQHIKEYARELYANSNMGDSTSPGEDVHFTKRWVHIILATTMKVYKNILYYTTKTLDIILPHLLALEAISVTVMKLLYILKLTPYHHPLFALFGMRLVKQRLVSPSNTNADTAPSTLTIQSPTTSSYQRSWHLTAIMGLVFTIRAVDWMMNTDHQTEHINQRITTPIAPPPPPQPIKVASDGIIPHRNTRLCPICNKERTNPCATSSGYVFCYMCIFPIVRDTQQCPVTKLPCAEHDLIRLYENLNN